MLVIINEQMNGIQLGRHIDEYGGKRKVKKKVMRCHLDEDGCIAQLDSFVVKECKTNGELVRASNFDEFLKKHQPGLHGG